MSTFDHDSLPLLAEALDVMEDGFGGLPDYSSNTDLNRLRGVLNDAARRMRDNFPYQHPLYMGQMLKPPHEIARLGYMLAMYVNPNNHALDGGRASSEMEKEAVGKIAEMFGWSEYLGHLCGGGTMANFEALWIGRQLSPGKTVVASQQAHYTHSRLSAVLDVPFIGVPVDTRGCIDPNALERILNEHPVGTVVATLGATASGAVDPLPEILALKQRYGFRLHVDTAYGGYFKLAGNLHAHVADAYRRIDEADSIVVDPHKHGLQPYGCGCVLFKNPSLGRFYKHDSPYTYFSSKELHLGEITLECSRAGASAVGLWSTLQMFPLEVGGEFAGMLESCREAALLLHRELEQDAQFVPLFDPQLDIVTWAVRAQSASASSDMAQKIFDAAAEQDLHLALASFPRAMCETAAVVEEWDAEQLTCLRACAMKPEHCEWMPEIVKRLRSACLNAVSASSR